MSDPKPVRKKIVAGNWKMNLSLQEGEALISKVLSLIKSEKINPEIIIAPSLIHLASASKLISNSILKLAAQNCSSESKGAFTGEVSAEMIRSAGATHVIIGHSERRKIFGETEDVLRKKINEALNNGLIPIYCVGETGEERNKNIQDEMVKQQIEKAFDKFTADQIAKIIIAYEPVWAIGTGKTATPQQAQEMHQHIRKLIEKIANASVAQHIAILYGGSCTVENAAALFSQKDIDGGLIGGASLKAEDFVIIIKAAN